MLGRINTSSLSQLYRSQGNQYSTLISKIASGKEISKPSDDFVGYTRATGIETDVQAYKDINVNLTELKEVAQLASNVGDGIYEDLSRMKELDDLYATATADEKSTYEAEYDALKTNITNTIANTKYDGDLVVQAGSAGPDTVSLDNATSGGGTISLTFGTGDVVSVSGATIGTTDIGAELEKAVSYSVKADGYLTQIDRHIEMNENLITSKEQTASAITDLDEVKALAEATELQVRQQASVSMIAQANLMSGSVARLYQ